jgi:hypothetical protein
MGDVFKLFSAAQIKALDQKQIRALRKAVQLEIRNSPEIRKLLKAKVRPHYNRLKAAGRKK